LCVLKILWMTFCLWKMMKKIWSTTYTFFPYWLTNLIKTNGKFWKIWIFKKFSFIYLEKYENWILQKLNWFSQLLTIFFIINKIVWEPTLLKIRFFRINVLIFYVILKLILKVIQLIKLLKNFSQSLINYENLWIKQI